MRDIIILNTNYDVISNLSLTTSYFQDNDQRGVDDSALSELATIGVTYQALPAIKLVGEYGINSRAKEAASFMNDPYNGDKDGWDLLVQYGQNDTSKPGTWDISADYRYINPGFQPYSGTEWLGGPYTSAKLGITSNVDNVKGYGLYFRYVLVKNVVAQLSWYNLAPVETLTGGDGDYRQSVRLMIDFQY